MPEIEMNTWFWCAFIDEMVDSGRDILWYDTDYRGLYIAGGEI